MLFIFGIRFGMRRKLKVSSKIKRKKFAKFLELNPAILLSGVWLKEAGFNIADYVEIEISENKLVITKK